MISLALPPPPYRSTEGCDDCHGYHPGSDYPFLPQCGCNSPKYDCSVMLEQQVLLKIEFAKPGVYSPQRSWQRVRCELRGTRLGIRMEKRDCVLSLQAADAGLAPDYRKRSNTIRVRAEGYQFLMALPSMAACLQWIEMLDAATSISTPLDDRRDEKGCFTIAPPRSRPSLGVATSGDGFERMWWEDLRRSSPSQIWLRGPRLQCESTFYKTLGCRVASSLWCSMGFVDNEATSMKETVANCDIGESKWTDTIAATVRSSVGWNFEQDYARRCVRWLLYDSPWKSDWYYDHGARVPVESPHHPHKAVVWPMSQGNGCPCARCRRG